MAAAKKCDICGKFYEPYNLPRDRANTNGIMFLNIQNSGDYHNNNVQDCCPECMESIKKHIENIRFLGTLHP